MKNTVSFFAQNKKQFHLINETKFCFVNRFVITNKRNTVETEFAPCFTQLVVVIGKLRLVNLPWCTAQVRKVNCWISTEVPEILFWDLASSSSRLFSYFAARFSQLGSNLITSLLPVTSTMWIGFDRTTHRPFHSLFKSRTIAFLLLGLILFVSFLLIRQNPSQSEIKTLENPQRLPQGLPTFSVKFNPSLYHTNGTEVIYQIPSRPKAVLFIAHGCTIHAYFFGTNPQIAPTVLVCPKKGYLFFKHSSKTWRYR
jgi:hypothetical protein